MERPISIYLVINDGDRLLYQVAHVNDDLYNEIQEYIDEFNDVANKYEKDHPEHTEWIKLTFEIGPEREGQISSDSNLQYFFSMFFNAIDDLSVDKFVSGGPYAMGDGYSKKVVDDIFRMDVVREHVNYDNWVDIVVYFENVDAMSIVGEFGILSSDLGAWDDFMGALNQILDRYNDDFRLKTDEGYDVFQPNEIRVVESNNYAFDRIGTFIAVNFWKIIFENATDEELSIFKSFNDDKINSLIESEEYRRYPENSLDFSNV